MTNDKECRIQALEPEAPPLTLLFSVTPLQLDAEEGALLVLANITEQEREGAIDVIMPKLNGRELAERLQTMQPEVKVAYMSGYAADIVATRGLLEEGVQLLQKPFTTETLTRKLREVLDS